MPVSRTRKPQKKSGRTPQRGGGRPSGGGRAPTRSADRRRPWAVVIAVLLVCALGAGVLAALGSAGGGGGDDASQEEFGDPALADVAHRDPDDPLAVGDVDAPVVLVEFLDFQCAYCGIHARETHPWLVDEYVDTGKVRIEFRNFPIYGPESDTAARAAWAAGRQGRFWEFYSAAMDEEFDMDSGRFSDEGVLALAEEAGVPDLDAFRRDLDSTAAGEAVGRDAEEALSAGVTQVPAFLANGAFVGSAQDQDAFRDVLDEAYEAATD
ncbi:DsbA family protein [Streptomyces sp. NPDC049881]|uniref:DsbA family protein n=1 Tax=Streptomyces sp. NPDC049881 TaxID=3155778 RepID=UPI0034141C24